MTENNTFLDIIGNCEPVSILRSGKNTLDCIVNYKDENGITTEYTLFFDKDKISIRNNFTGVFFKDQDYSFNILATIINDIIANTSSYEENVPYHERSEKAQLKNLIARIIFENIDDIDYIVDFNTFTTATIKRESINEMNYSVLFKICCEAGKLKFVENLFLNIPNYNIDAQSFKNNEEIAAAACFGGKPEIFWLLKNKGFYFGEFSLERAFVSRNFGIFDFLLKKNLVDINAKDENGHSLLNRLIINNYDNLERLLYYNIGETDEDYLDRKEKGLLTKKEVRKELKYTKLKKRKIISELKKVQMELDKCNEQSQIDILLGKQEEILSVIRRFEEKEVELEGIKNSFLDIDINTKDDCECTPLYYASKNGNIEMAQLLLSQPGIDINAKNKDGQTPFLNAVAYGHMEITKLLLSQPGIDINAKDNFGYTPLICAAAIGYTEIVRLLLSQPGVEINARNYYRHTPLHLATLYKCTEIVQLLLLQPGIDINAKDKKGCTPLICAAFEGHGEIVQLLLQQPGIEIEESYLPTIINLISQENFDECTRIRKEKERNIQNLEQNRIFKGKLAELSNNFFYSVNNLCLLI